MGETADPLAIDPTVLVLQVVAFVILFLLLRRYLFRPLLAMMGKREEEIARALDDGERARQELARIGEEEAKALASAREEGRELVRQSVQEAEETRQRMLAEARQEAQEVRQRAQEAIALEREAAELELRQQVVELALLAASRAVLGRLDAQEHRQVVDDFISDLEGRA
jgi:F-type H+-transporting ATPase subunit b